MDNRLFWLRQARLRIWTRKSRLYISLQRCCLSHSVPPEDCSICTHPSYPETAARVLDNRGTAGDQQLPESESILNQEVLEVFMASKRPAENWTEETICRICLRLFIDPVILECGHNFCLLCLTRCCEREERNSCPECREVVADRTLRVNRPLANLAEKARNLILNRKGKESKLHCEEHEEELKLFCETDKTLICLICAAAQEHREHRFMMIKEAVKIYMDQLQSFLDSLMKKKSDVQEKEQQQEEKISGVREQSKSVQTHITSQFDELRRIITEKEQSLLGDLRKEEERILNPMENNLHEIQENIRLIQEEITKLKEQMDQKDIVIFFKEEARRNRRMNNDVQELTVIDGTLPSEKFDHPYLLNTVLRETLDAINRVSVTLDGETASPCLQVSEDRKSVRRLRTQRDLPVTGKRFTNLPCVLGSKGFTSGRRYWEVKVAGNLVWGLGVAAVSVERKRGFRLSPETGFWVIGRVYDVLLRDYYVFQRDSGGIFIVHTSPVSGLHVDPIPERVGVYLSYESGTVSFYNAETKSHLHTFSGNKFTEKLYPLFWTWDENQWLRICSGSAQAL